MTYPRGGYYDKEYMESSKALLHMENVTDSRYDMDINKWRMVCFSGDTSSTDVVKGYSVRLSSVHLYAFFNGEDYHYRVCTYHL